jgi:LacI family transcriptional regulator
MLSKRSLAVENQIHLIGLIVPDLADTHFSDIARGVARVLRPRGYTVLLSDSDGDPAAERQAVEVLIGCPQVDGLIVASAQPPEEAGGLFRLVQKHKPYVLTDRKFIGLDANFVGVDDEQIGETVAEHLIARGCRHIAHIMGPENSCGLERRNGYTAALARHGLKVCPGYVVRGGSNDTAGYRAMQELLSVNPRLDGVVCFNDAVAVGAVKAILEAGLEVPYDIEVVGAGNVHYSDILRVPLSTVHLNGELMGERAAALLLNAIESPGAAPEQVLIPFELVARASSEVAV